MKNRTKTKRMEKRPYRSVSYILVFVMGFLFASLAYEINFAGNAKQLKLIETTKIVYATSNVVAVSSQDNAGLIGKVTAEIRPGGEGRVLINTNPFLEPDTQQSAETATKVAESYTGKSLGDRDIILSFNITGEVLGGPSAGAAMTTAVIAAIEGKTVRSNAVITGTINNDSTVGPIGGILEKAAAAAENNMTLFLIPKGQGKLQYYEQKVQEQKIGRFVYQRIYYVPKTIDVNNYTMTQWNMPTKEVSTISDAVGYMIE